jgi:hypothetical protein
MSLNELLPGFMKFRRSPRRLLLLSSFLALALLLAGATGCAPNSSPGAGTQSSSDSPPSDLPELGDEVIRERINDAWLREVPEDSGSAEPISWRFDADEPKEITVVEKKMNGKRATIVLDIKTQTGPNRRNPRALAGQIRTEWELKTGWALRRWEIVETENISMKYRNIPKPPANDSNR